MYVAELGQQQREGRGRSITRVGAWSGNTNCCIYFFQFYQPSLWCAMPPNEPHSLSDAVFFGLFSFCCCLRCWYPKKVEAFKQQKEFLVSLFILANRSYWFVVVVVFLPSGCLSVRPDHTSMWSPEVTPCAVPCFWKWPKVFCQVIRWIDISIMFYQSQTKSHGINQAIFLWLRDVFVVVGPVRPQVTVVPCVVDGYLCSKVCPNKLHTLFGAANFFGPITKWGHLQERRWWTDKVTNVWTGRSGGLQRKQKGLWNW